MTKDEALKLALEALERGETKLRWEAITAIKEALAQPEERYFCPRCGKRLGLGGIHTCTPPQIDPNAWAFDRGLEST